MPACRSRTRSRDRCCRRWDSLASGSLLQVFAEFTLDIAFTIAMRPGTAGPVSIAAYPVARAQVARWVAKKLPHAKFQTADSNAAAAVDVAEGRADAAVTTELATTRYGLTAFATDVIDEPNARTRFRVGRSAGAAAGPHRRRPKPRWCCVSTTFPARFAAALTEFAIRDIDLTRIESRPTRTELGTYIFFVDCVRPRRRQCGR